MSVEPRRQLHFLTGFLVVAGVVGMASLLYGSARDPDGTDRPGVVTVAAPTTTAAAAPTTTIPVVTTTTQPAAPTTTQAEPAVLDPKDAEDIKDAVGPTVAFVTTFNGSGSGVLIDDDILVTNAHVVWPFRTVGVLFPGDSQRTGYVVGVDARTDLAFVRVDSPRLPAPLAVGEVGGLEVGQELFVVGYPLAADFTPETVVATGAFLAVLEWEFAGSNWIATDAAAIGGQSGGALVDEFGRLVGITTFGSPAELFAVTVDDVHERAALVQEETLGGLDERRPPRQGGRLEHDISLEGPWDQAAFVTWLSPGAESHLTSDLAVSWRALDPFGVELDTGDGVLDVFWLLATPGVVLAESDSPASSFVQIDRPIVPVVDPDDARTIRRGPGLSGFMDVPGDRDWFYFEVGDATTTPTTVVVDAQTRVRISLYERKTGALMATVVHEKGFFFDDPALIVESLAPGSYVIAVEDVGAQFGSYRIIVD